MCSVLTILDDELNSESVFAATVLQMFGNPTLLCVLGSRMFFNVKEAAEHNVNVGTNWSSYENSALHFEELPFEVA